MVARKVPLESAFQAKVIAYLKSIGAYVIKIHVSSYQLEGEPDIVCCYKGRFYAFELKTGSKASQLQLAKLGKIEQSGGIAMIIKDLDHLKEVMEFYDNF